MKKLAIAFLMSASAFAQAAITGSVFQDFDTDGVFTTTATNALPQIDQRVAGVVVTSFDASGACGSVATSATTGAYSINPASTAAPNNVACGTGTLRIEFTAIPAGFAEAGLQGATAVQFVADGGTANLALSKAADYCQVNPLLVTSQYAFRTPTSATDTGAPDGALPVIRTAPYNFVNEFDGDINANWTANTIADANGFSNSPPNGVRPPPSNQALQSQVGAVWGLAYERKTNRLFSSAFMKRRSPFGTGGPGAIYVTNPESGTSTTDGALYVDLNTVFATAPTPGGTNPHPTATTAWTTDLNGIAGVGKLGLGDIDVNSTGTTLYTIGLNSRRLYVIPTSGALDNTTITSFAIPTPSAASPVTNLSNCTNAADVRPFAVGLDSQDRVYVGATCTEEGTGGTVANVRYYIFRLNSSNTFDAVSEGRFRATVFTSNRWETPSGTTTTQTTNIQAWLTDISFDRGDMVLGVRDRFGDQIHNALTPYENPFARGFGDIVKSCANTGAGLAFIQESAGVCGGVTAAAAVEPTGTTNTDGVLPAGIAAAPANNREWYSGDNAADNGVPANSTPIRNNREGGNGGTLAIPGFRDVIETAYDPVDRDNIQNLVNANFNTGGFKRFDRSTGALQGNYDIYERIETNNFAKGNGMGDVEALCDPQPIRIGNRLFVDANNNGLQDPAEAGIPNITVNLYNAAGTIVGSTTTDANGNYRFDVQRATADEAAGSRNDANVFLANANLYGQTFTVGIPGTTTTGFGAGGTNNVPNTLIASPANQGAGAQQNARDSEGVLIAIPTATTMVAASVTLPTDPGQNSFTIDFGFASALDYGDLPDTVGSNGPGNYATLLADSGPSNLISTPLRLGVAAGSSSFGYDAETDGQPSNTATGDNGNRDNDENGATFTNAVRGGNAPTISLSVFNNTGATRNVCAYADLNNNGTFEAGETFTSTVPSNASAQTVAASFTDTTTAGQTFANSRLYVRARVQEGACSPNGFGGAGEIEDFAIPVAQVSTALSAIPNYCPGNSTTYTITFSNAAAASDATAFPVTADLVGPTNEPGLAGTPVFAVASWAVTTNSTGASLATASGSGDINTTAIIPAGGSITVTVQGTFANAASGAQSTSADINPAVGFVDSNANDLTSATAAQNATCTGTTTGSGALCANLTTPPAALVCSGAANTVVNAYHAGVANVAQGSRCIRVNPTALTGSVGTIAAGDTLLVIQMQDADLNTTDTPSYGDGTSGAPGGALAAPAPTAGRHEYVIAQSGVQTSGAVLGSCAGQSDVIEISGGNSQSPGIGTGGTISAYSATSPDTFQVVRVAVTGAVSFTGTACSFGAPSWNGSAGGIVAIDSTGSINLGGAAATVRIDASGDGFRGGACAANTPGSTTPQFASSTAGISSQKGEGAAGAPALLTGGGLGLGAPATGGGAGQTCNITNGLQGAGGGANGGGGGNGGGGTAATCTTNPGGHGGGTLATVTDFSRLTLGGGGGAGSRVTGATACDGGVGGGLVILRANALSGTGTINANAAVVGGSLASARAGGGGGAGGTVIVQTSIGGGTSYSGITVNANGAAAVSNAGVAAGGSGGGGGGRILIAQTAAVPSGTRAVTSGTGGNTNSIDGTAGIIGVISTGLDPVNTSIGVKPAYICAQNSTVPVTLSKVEVSNSGSDLLVRFNTATEAGTLGYRILADVGAANAFSRTELGFVESKNIDSLKEQSYELRTRSIGAAQIWIEEQSVDGKSALYGPYQVGASVGEANLAPAMNWAAVNAEQLSFRTSQQVNLRGQSAGIAEVSVSQDQWLSFSASELAAAGLAGDIRVNQGTRSVASSTQRDANGTVTRIGFYAKAQANSIYTKTAIYRLTSGSSLAMATLNAQSQGGAASVLSDRIFDQNKIYSFTAPSDPWFNFRAIRNIAGTSSGGSSSFTLGDYAGAGAERISLNYWGGSSYSGAGLDHSVQFLLNGQVVGSDRFDGFAARTLDIALPEGALRAGANTLSVQMVNDTGFASDIVNIESYTLRYRRNLSAENNRLEATIQAIESNDGFASGFEDAAVNPSNGPNSYVITNLTAPSVVLRERAGVQTLLATSSGSEVAVQFDAQVGDRLIVSPATSSAALNSAAAASDPIGSSSASYLIISHPSFIGGLSQFVSAKQAQGFTVKVVDVEALYRYYNAGVVDPAAISLAIRNAQRTGTTHVLLVGGDTYDYHNVLGINSVSFVPTNYRRTDAIINFAPADSVYADTDGNGAPNVALGRWPVRTQAELQAVIAKTLSYQNRKVAVMVNDRALNGERYSQADAPFAALLPQDWSKQLVDLDGFTDTAIARAEIVSKLTQGASLLSYYGHSAPSSWSREGLITATQLSNGLMSGVNQSFVTVQLGCWGTYFVEPTSTTVAHQLLLMPKGAAAVLGASTLTLTNSDKAFAERLLPSIGTGTLGENLKTALQSLSADPSAGDVSVGGALLGDPALR